MKNKTACVIGRVLIELFRIH